MSPGLLFFPSKTGFTKLGLNQFNLNKTGQDLKLENLLISKVEYFC